MENQSPSSSSTSPESISSLDHDKIQKIITNYQKLKNQNALLKKAIIQEQQKNGEIDRDLKQKEQALTTCMQEHDILEFNNQRLTKRIQTMQEEMNNKKEGGGGSWFFQSSKQELLKREEEINLLKTELQEKIDDNVSLHSVTNDKELAFKQMDASLRLELTEKDKLLHEKDSKIDDLVRVQRENEQNLLEQTRGLRNNIDNLENNIKRILSSLIQRDDILDQTNDLIKNCIDNLPTISINYPLENITPSNERISFESLIFDKDFSVDIDQSSIESLINQSIVKKSYKTMFSQLQSIFSQHLEQLSTIVSSHTDSIKKLDQQNQVDKSKLSESIHQLTLLKEENEYRLNSTKDELSQKNQNILNLTRQTNEQSQLLEKLVESNKRYEDDIVKENEKTKSIKSKSEKDLEDMNNSHKLEIKQISDQHQGLLKHQKQLLQSKIDDQKSTILQLEKKVTTLESMKSSSPTLIPQPSTNNNNNNNLINLLDDDSIHINQQSPSNHNNNNNNNIVGDSLIDVSIPSNQNEIIVDNQDQQQQKDNELIEQQPSQQQQQTQEEEEEIVVVIPNQSITPSSPLLTETSTIPPSGRFKLTVLDETGELSDKLNFSFEDKEREKEMKSYYENKITQLLNKISNIDAKAIRYYEQYNALLKKGQENEGMQKEIDKAKLEAKNTKEELDVTRSNYDQQMKMLTEQYISLNESISTLDSDLIRIKQHKVVCGKCKAWNPLDHIFSNDNHNLVCLKGNHQIQTIIN